MYNFLGHHAYTQTTNSKTHVIQWNHGNVHNKGIACFIRKYKVSIDKNKLHVLSFRPTRVASTMLGIINVLTSLQSEHLCGQCTTTQMLLLLFYFFNVCSQHVNWTEQLVTRVSVTAWLAKLGWCLANSEHMYSNAVVHTAVRELQFSSGQVMCREQTFIGNIFSERSVAFLIIYSQSINEFTSSVAATLLYYVLSWLCISEFTLYTFNRVEIS